MPKPLSLECQQMVLKLINYFEAEKVNNGPFLPLAAVRERAAHALQLSISTVSKLSVKRKRNEPLISPKLSRNKKKPIVEINTNTEDAIRSVIDEMYDKHMIVTQETILKILKDRKIFNGSISSLRRIMLNMGFEWRKDGNKRILVELPHIVLIKK